MTKCTKSLPAVHLSGGLASEKLKKVNRARPRGALRGAEFMRDLSTSSLLPPFAGSGASSLSAMVEREATLL
jgi:hypothetical protein